MNYQWYPGHMTKAKRMMQENMKLIDLIIELVDARIPFSSRNPDIDELGKNKSRIILLNKSDLSDPVWNKKWVQYFESKGAHVLEINSKTGAGVKSIQGLVQEACREKIERDRKRGIVNRPVRAMVVGIPNVGKSTFINSFAGKACAKTGNKPGVTKGKQWIRLNKNLELLDTPGILWPKFEDQIVGRNLAFIGSMNDEVIIMEELACDLLKVINEFYPNAVDQRYGQQDEKQDDRQDEQIRDAATQVGINDPIRQLHDIARSRRCYSKGKELDIEKAASILIDDFRSGKLGRMTFERAGETKDE